MAIMNNAGVEYETVDTLMAMAHANANTLLAVLIETREAVENAEEILLPGIDLVLVGHQDLAQSLGVPGEFGHPKVREATARVNAICRERRIATAGAINQPENAEAVVRSGAQFLLYGTDLILMRREAERAVKAVDPYRKK
jgi:2-keto-3-deoxy-L-rhamnonate aldolase RhmA